MQTSCHGHIGFWRPSNITTGPQLSAPTVFNPQFHFPLLHKILGPSSFLTSAICNALGLLPCSTSHISNWTLNLPLWSPSCLHHGKSHPPSLFSQDNIHLPPQLPLGLCRTKGRQLGCCQQYTSATLPGKCCAHWHWPRASLGSPQPRGLLGCSLWPLGRPAALPPPQQLQEQRSCLTDHMLHRFCPTFSLWCCMVTTQERARHGQEFVLDTDSPSVRGREKKNQFLRVPVDVLP